MEYYVTKDGKNWGPYTEAQLRAEVAKGTFSANDSVWREGLSAWVPMSGLIDVPTQGPPPPIPAAAGSKPKRKGCCSGCSGLIVLAIIISIIVLPFLPQNESGSLEKSRPQRDQVNDAKDEQPTSANAPPEKPAPETVSAPPKPDEIVYDIFESWRIPNGGYGRAIIISPTHANQADLTKLASTLKGELKDTEFAFVFVFTSKEAAELRHRAGNLTPEESATYRKAFVGKYQKNDGQGIEEMEIHPDGLDGSFETIKP